ncbi:hypothetical protein AB6A40_005292 [Gnathostoma spinigerum]|uniref:Uncharacterized protein n=1 Tax=Gnathostoma spinigerum TaxID=75299 RepID=A0ABD6ENM5_9BILA
MTQQSPFGCVQLTFDRLRDGPQTRHIRQYKSDGQPLYPYSGGISSFTVPKPLPQRAEITTHFYNPMFNIYNPVFNIYTLLQSGVQISSMQLVLAMSTGSR